MGKTENFCNADETLDSLFNGRISVIQRRSGYRFSIDALLLAHFAAPRKYDRIADLGAGSGVVPLILAALHPGIEVCGVELQAAMVRRARRSAELNGLDRRVRILEGDVRAVRRLLPAGSFNMVVANPPYRLAASGRINPDREKHLARHETDAKLADFLAAAAFLLRRSGKIAVVYPASRLVDLLHAMREQSLEPKRLRLVHSFAGAEASLALVEATKEGRAELKILPPLTIYTDDRKYTAEVEGILAGKGLPEG